jgi:N-acetylmuramoyl-L-alanine amidase
MKRLLYEKLAVLFLLLWLTPSLLLAKKLIVINADYGGSQTGPISGNQLSKVWNLKFALALQQTFLAHQYKVLMIRTGDQQIPEKSRIFQINTSKALLAISIQADREWTYSCQGTWVIISPPTRQPSLDSNGLEKWGSLPYSLYKQDRLIAENIIESLSENPKLNSWSNFYFKSTTPTSTHGRVLCLPDEDIQYATIPSIVLIPMFLTSKFDLKKFSNTDRIDAYAKKIFMGIQNALNILDSTQLRKRKFSGNQFGNN